MICTICKKDKHVNDFYNCDICNDCQKEEDETLAAIELLRKKGFEVVLTKKVPNACISRFTLPNQT
jgi:hypothetical protein